MNRSSIFKKKIDFIKSHGSYLVDKDSQKKYLDFFGQYSTLAIGYNHRVFKTQNYLNEVKSLAHQKITNCEILSTESAEFDHIFRDYTSRNIFSHYHYSCTGALAIEAAIKTAMDYKGKKFNRIISFKKSFHGINGYGGIFTDRFGPVEKRLRDFPGTYWKPIMNPVINYENNKEIIDEDSIFNVINEIKQQVKKENNVCAILVEPIQCTFGDRYFSNTFFKEIRKISDQYDIPLIFDEIQVGFGSTGKLWYFEHLPIIPDILVFGKKTQLSGIAVQKKFAKIFNNSIRLEVTWDADIMDMLRCKYIIKAYKEDDVLKNVLKMSSRLSKGLSNIDGLLNIRNCGLLFAFDFLEKSQRDIFLNQLLKNNMLCNPTGEKTIRLRPNLLVKSEEIENSLSIIKLAADKI
jgi:L-lysine 6-transaminase